MGSIFSEGFRMIGLDCENIILDYKAQLEHRDNFKKCLEYFDRLSYEYYISDGYYNQDKHTIISRYVDRIRRGKIEKKWIKEYSACTICGSAVSFTRHVCRKPYFVPQFDDEGICIYCDRISNEVENVEDEYCDCSPFLHDKISYHR